MGDLFGNKLAIIIFFPNPGVRCVPSYCSVKLPTALARCRVGCFRSLNCQGAVTLAKRIFVRKADRVE